LLIYICQYEFTLILYGFQASGNIYTNNADEPDGCGGSLFRIPHATRRSIPRVCSAERCFPEVLGCHYSINTIKPGRHGAPRLATTTLICGSEQVTMSNKILSKPTRIDQEPMPLHDIIPVPPDLDGKESIHHVEATVLSRNPEVAAIQSGIEELLLLSQEDYDIIHKNLVKKVSGSNIVPDIRSTPDFCQSCSFCSSSIISIVTHLRK